MEEYLRFAFNGERELSGIAFEDSEEKIILWGETAFANYEALAFKDNGVFTIFWGNPVKFRQEIIDYLEPTIEQLYPSIMSAISWHGIVHPENLEQVRRAIDSQLCLV